MKTIYIADDGTQFGTAEECREYESTPTEKLAAFLHKNCEEFEIYCDDAGFNIPNLDHIAAFLIENKTKVIEFLTNQGDDGWVENTQTCNVQKDQERIEKLEEMLHWYVSGYGSSKAMSDAFNRHVMHVGGLGLLDDIEEFYRRNAE